MMEADERILLPNHEAVVKRFVAACEADGRVLRAFLGGSNARGEADEFSDLDLYVITTDEGFNEFYAEREVFLQMLGEPVFMEDFDIPDILFYVLADGTEGELGFGREGHFDQIHSGPYQVLVDKKNI